MPQESPKLARLVFRPLIFGTFNRRGAKSKSFLIFTGKFIGGDVIFFINVSVSDDLDDRELFQFQQLSWTGFFCMKFVTFFLL